MNAHFLKQIDPWMTQISCLFVKVISILFFWRRARTTTVLVRPGGMGDLVCLTHAIQISNLTLNDFLFVIETRSEPWAQFLNLNYICYDKLKIRDLLTHLFAYSRVINTEQRFGLSQSFSLSLSHPKGKKSGFETNRASLYLSTSLPYDVLGRHEILSFQDLIIRTTPNCQIGTQTPPALLPNIKLAPIRSEIPWDSLRSHKIALCLGGLQSPSRDLGEGFYSQLIQFLLAKNDVTLIYGPGETHLAIALLQRFSNLKVAQIAGMQREERPTFKDQVSFLTECDLVISMDSAMVHIANFLRKPVWAFFTSGVLLKWGALELKTEKSPLESLNVSGVPLLPCQPCGRFGQVPNCSFNYTCKKNLQLTLAKKDSPLKNNQEFMLVVDLDSFALRTPFFTEMLRWLLVHRPILFLSACLRYFGNKNRFYAFVYLSSKSAKTLLIWSDLFKIWWSHMRQHDRCPKILILTHNPFAQKAMQRQLEWTGEWDIKSIHQTKTIWFSQSKVYLFGDPIFHSRWKVLHPNLPIDSSEYHQKKHFPSTKVLLKQLRWHQWSKNLLLALPLVVSHQWHPLNGLLNLGLGFASFSLLASSVYIINDFLDIDNDRLHPSKKTRPLASGGLSYGQAGILTVILWTTSFLTSWELPTSFKATLVIYFLLTFFYSLLLKKLVCIDILCLSLLYCVRIFAGGELFGIRISDWFFMFTFFSFVSLALAKRVTELQIRSQNSKLSNLKMGRAYQIEDIAILRSAGIVTGLGSSLIFGLYASSPEAKALYSNLRLLWLGVPALLYWFLTFWIQVGRGKVTHDPVQFALKDRPTYLCIFYMAMVIWIAK